jgi:hypothetical protein
MAEDRGGDTGGYSLGECKPFVALNLGDVVEVESENGAA